MGPGPEADKTEDPRDLKYTHKSHWRQSPMQHGPVGREVSQEGPNPDSAWFRLGNCSQVQVGGPRKEFAERMSLLRDGLQSYEVSLAAASGSFLCVLPTSIFSRVVSQTQGMDR